MPVIPWTEIEAFYNVKKFIRVDPTEWWKTKEVLNGTSVVTYKSKVKLHGTNAGIQVHTDGTIVCQSRTNIITPESDNAGFARWAMSNAQKWVNARGMIIYGEWCGSGIQKGVAISDIGKKVFAVFAARPLDLSDKLIIEPEDLSRLVEDIPETYVLPWHQSIDINWRHTDEQLKEDIAPINEWVDAIEANDPWVEQTFGVKGTGEGIVFYPVSQPHLGYENFVNLVFKAKGEKHKNIKTATPAQVNPEVAASTDAFVDLVLTPARLDQGAKAISANFDIRMTGQFINWITKDVEKETQDELTASNLTFKQVQKLLSEKARGWYRAKCEE